MRGARLRKATWGFLGGGVSEEEEAWGAEVRGQGTVSATCGKRGRPKVYRQYMPKFITEKTSRYNSEILWCMQAETLM